MAIHNAILYQMIFEENIWMFQTLEI
jgi:hypothetical protein